MMPRILCLLLLSVLCFVPSLPAMAEETVVLVGENMDSWRKPRGDWIVVGSAEQDPQAPSRIILKPGSGVLANGMKGKTRNLLSQHEHGDVAAHIEFMVPKGSNSGIYFQGRYELQVLDSWGVGKPGFGDCGGIYQGFSNGKSTPGHAPRVNAARRPGEWQAFDVVFRAPRFDASGKKTENARFVTVSLNGQVIHENVELLGPTIAPAFSEEKPRGPVMLQGDHGPVAYRNIRLNSLADPKNESFSSLFDGETFTGWRKIGGGDWDISDGVLRGTMEKSEPRHGHLITDRKYRDFSLRLKYKAIAGNSGLYFRVEEGGNAGVKGFQAEIDPNNDVGGLYETYGRGWVIKPKSEEVKQWHKVNQWNEMRVDAIGGNITVYVNDHKTAELTDDPGRREGYIALQLHGGATMDANFKDIEILEYDPHPTSDSP